MCLTEINLSAEQKQVTENLNDNILVLASAGTGKTETIARRIANIIDSQSAQASEILCLSFTNRAAKEMAERVNQLVQTEMDEVTVKTIHSFCYMILKEYSSIAGENFKECTVCDEEDTRDILADVLSIMKVKDGIFSMIAVNNFLSAVKLNMSLQKNKSLKECVENIFVEKAEYLKNEICTDKFFAPDPLLFNFLKDYGAVVLENYENRLRRDKLLDFTDLLLYAKKICEDSHVHNIISKRFKYVHIDEVQDMSETEYSLITFLSPNSTFLLCGDVNQTIYQWRGSNPAYIIDRFKKEYNAVEIVFTKNFRSKGGIVDIANKYINRDLNSELYDEASRSLGEIEINGFNTPKEQSSWIYEQLKKIGEDINWDYSRVAVLGRTNQICKSISQGFEEYRRENGEKRTIPYIFADDIKLFRRKEVKDVTAFLKFILNPNDNSSFKRICENYSKGISKNAIRDITGIAGELAGVMLTDFANSATHAYGDCFYPLTEALENENVVVLDVESTGIDVYKDNVVQIAAIRINKKGDIVESFEQFIKPDKPVGMSEKVHGFSDDYLKEHGRDVKKVLSDFRDFVGTTVVVGHNIGYDLGILGAEYQRNNVKPLEYSYFYDTLDISRRYVKNIENHKLGTLSDYFETAHKPSHDAMDDITATAQVLVAMYNQFLLKQEAERREFYAKYMQAFDKITNGFNLLRKTAQETNVYELADIIVQKYGVLAKYKNQPDRIGSIRDFLDFIRQENNTKLNIRENIHNILELAALSSTELDRLGKNSGKLAIITVHQAKGCEFDYVFLPFMMEYIFPSYLSIKKDTVEEEKRLFYVALTRAKKKVFISWSRVNNKGNNANPSRFLGMLG